MAHFDIISGCAKADIGLENGIASAHLIRECLLVDCFTPQSSSAIKANTYGGWVLEAMVCRGSAPLARVTPLFMRSSHHCVINFPYESTMELSATLHKQTANDACYNNRGSTASAETCSE